MLKKIFKWALLLLLATGVVWTFVFLWKKSRPEQVSYETHTVVRGNIEKRTVVTGKVEPRDEVLIKPQLSGIISELYKEAGQPVKAGEVIAKIKVIPDMATLNSAESRVRLAEFNFAQTERNFERDRQLYDKQVISREEFEKSQLQYNADKEELESARNNLSITRDGIAAKESSFTNTLVRSTITGMILDIPIKVGNSVIQSNTFNDGTTIATVADMGDMLFVGKMDETEVGRLYEGMEMELIVGAINDKRFDAVLEYISPKALEENGAIMFEIKGAAHIPDSVNVRSGYSANAEIVLAKREDVLTLPESTIEFSGDSVFVNLLTDTLTQSVVRTPVQVGLSDGISIEIVEGLKEGDIVRGNRK